MSKYFLFIFPKLIQNIITNIIVKIEQRHGDTNGDTSDTSDTNDTIVGINDGTKTCVSSSLACSTAHLHSS
jgi:hypothetical protein